jgi:hypothetical protein
MLKRDAVPPQPYAQMNNMSHTQMMSTSLFCFCFCSFVVIGHDSN